MHFRFDDLQQIESSSATEIFKNGCGGCPVHFRIDDLQQVNYHASENPNLRENIHGEDTRKTRGGAAEEEQIESKYIGSVKIIT